MAQRSHVPKFGNWDGDNVPYTAYFENARKEKAGGVRMNPNDPEENPEAFMFGGDDLPHSFPANSVQTSLDKSTASEKYQSGGHKQHRGHGRNSSDQQKSMTPSESGEKSISDNSSLQLRNHQHKSSDRRNSSGSSNGFTRLKGGRNPSDDLSSRSASVPKFGEWDERDPKSGEGFTVIFNRVKEEKQIAATKFPPVQPQTDGRETQKKKPRSKMLCCLF